MVAAKTARKVSVLPRMIEMEVRIVPTGVMPHPLFASIDVRGVRVPGLVAVIAVFYGGVCFSANGSRAMSRSSMDGASFAASFTASFLRKCQKCKHQESYE
jgi:hypothetical protein